MVIVDQWALVRLGVARALAGLSFRVVGEAGDGDAALALVRSSDAELVVVGPHLQGCVTDVVSFAAERAKASLVLVEYASRDLLRALASAGASGIVPVSASAAELSSAAGQVASGEKVLSPRLVPALAGLAEPPEAPSHAGLSPREQQVLACLATGMSNGDIAERLYMAPSTVKTHLTHLYAKLGVSTRQEAMRRAVELGFMGAPHRGRDG